jgi:hypothetical protein
MHTRYQPLLLALVLYAFAPLVLAASDPIHIYGIHSWGFGANGLLNGKTGWTVEVVNTDEWPYDLTVEQAQNIRNEGWGLIIRINKFFGQTVPENPADFDAFAAACAQKVQTFSDYCHIWIIGNEMNADFEGAVSVATYEQVYRTCRDAIHAVQPNAVVLVAPLAPWNASTTGVGPYPSNRQWLNYFYDLVHRLGTDADGFAIHAYGGRGGDSDPRDDNEMGFGVYERWMEIITGYTPTAMKPVYLTEMNHAADGQGSTPGYPLYSYPAGYIQKLFEEIGTYNQAHENPIRSACWFSYANGGFPGYNISTNSQMADDFRDSTSTTNWIGFEPFTSASLGWMLR